MVIDIVVIIISINIILRDARVLCPCITVGHFLQVRVNQGSWSAVSI